MHKPCGEMHRELPSAKLSFGEVIAGYFWCLGFALRLPLANGHGRSNPGAGAAAEAQGSKPDRGMDEPEKRGLLAPLVGSAIVSRHP